MMERVGQPEGPSITTVEMSAVAVEGLGARFAAAHPDVLVRRLRGHKARTLARFFDELAAALQLPVDFAEDWYAVRDCADDLLRGRRGVVLIVANAGWLLADEPDERAMLVTTFAQLHDAARARGQAFQLVLQESAGGMTLLDAFAA